MKIFSKNNQQNEIKYDHQEFYFDNCDKYFTQLSNEKDHFKNVSNVENVTKTLSL